MTAYRNVIKGSCTVVAILSASVATGNVIVTLPDVIADRMANVPIDHLDQSMQRCVGMDWKSAPKPNENRFCRRYQLEKTVKGKQVTAQYVAVGEPFMLGPEIPTPSRTSGGQLVSTADRLFPPAGSMPDSMTMQQPSAAAWSGEPGQTSSGRQGSRLQPPGKGESLDSLNTSTSTPVMNAIISGVTAIREAMGRTNRPAVPQRPPAAAQPIPMTQQSSPRTAPAAVGHPCPPHTNAEWHC